MIRGAADNLVLMEEVSEALGNVFSSVTINTTGVEWWGGDLERWEKEF